MPAVPSQPNALYADAEVYDILHAPGTREDVRGLLAIARRFCPPAAARDALWLEPACGTGRHLRELSRRGFRVAGFDLDAGMVRYARASLAPRDRAHVFRARMESFARPGLRVAAAFNLINTIRHLSSDRAVLAHLARVARTLAPGGIYIVGISLSAYGLEGPTEDVWRARRAGTGVTQVVQYLPPDAARGPGARHERVLSHLTIRRGRRTRHADAAYVLRTYSRAQWESLVASSALRTMGVVDEAGADLATSELGYHVYVLGQRAGGSTRRRRTC